MSNSYFQFKQFIIHQDACAMKVTTDACLFGAWAARLLANQQPQSILDIGSGTGLLSLMVAQQTRAAIDAVEIQEADYLQSVQNISASPFKNQVNLFHADARKLDISKKYDAIISNPPFYQKDLKSERSSKNIAHHDDSLTLQVLFTIIARHLLPSGRFYLLLPAKRNADIEQQLVSSGFYIENKTWVHQSEKHAAFRVMLEGSFTMKPCREDHLMIREGVSYSQNFVELLRPYYLYLDAHPPAKNTQ